MRVEIRIMPAEKSAGKIRPSAASLVMIPLRPNQSVHRATARPPSAAVNSREGKSILEVKRYLTAMPGKTAWPIPSISMLSRFKTTKTPGIAQASAVVIANMQALRAKDMSGAHLLCCEGSGCDESLNQDNRGAGGDGSNCSFARGRREIRAKHSRKPADCPGAGDERDELVSPLPCGDGGRNDDSDHQHYANHIDADDGDCYQANKSQRSDDI